MKKSFNFFVLIIKYKYKMKNAFTFFNILIKIKYKCKHWMINLNIWKKVHLFIYLCCVWVVEILAGKTEIWTTVIYCPKLYIRAVVLLFWQRTHPPAPILWLSGSNTFFSASFLSSRSSGSPSTSSRNLSDSWERTDTTQQHEPAAFPSEPPEPPGRSLGPVFTAVNLALCTRSSGRWR